MKGNQGVRSYIPVFVITAFLFALVFWSYASAKNKPGTVVLPGGITYLGPSPSTPSTPSTPTWSSRTGTIYPYSFDYPSSMNLGVFPNDPSDAVTAFIEGTDSGSNIFFRIETLKESPEAYAKNWWKQYNWKGVSKVSAFTNSKGLKGYRATYLDQNDKTPYDHVFFEIPGKKDRIIWLSGRLFSKEDFDTLIDSVNWNY